MKKNANIIIISAPSGGGKSSICNALLQQDNNIALSISATTRAPRPGEEEGLHYFFKSKDEFEDMLQNDEFLESATIYGNNYGTPKSYVEEKLNNGIDVLFDIDTQGAKQIMQIMPERVVSIFLLPPDMEALRNRLIKRNQDTEESIEKRLAEAEAEISQSDIYAHKIVNYIFENTLKEVQNIINNARIKTSSSKKK